MQDAISHGSSFDYAAIEERLANRRTRILLLASLPSIFVFLILAAWFESLMLAVLNIILISITMVALTCLKRGYSRIAKLMFLIPANLTVFAFADSSVVSTGIHMFYIPALLVPLACFPRSQANYGVALSSLSATLWFIQLYFPPQLIFPPVEGLTQLSPAITAVGVAVILAAFFYKGLLEFAELLIESETAKAESMQQSRLAAIGELASNIAHEVNNPLAIITLKSQILVDRLLQTKELPAEFREVALRDTEKIVSVCQRIAKIIDGLRLISRADASDDLETISLHQIIDQTLQVAREQWRDLNISVSHASNEIEREACIVGRPVQISQVLINLLNNSEFATRNQQARWVRIETQDRIQEWLIEVIDSGPILSPEAKLKLNQPFYTTKPPGVGTGLGLSICRRIIQRHGGRLQIDIHRSETCLQIFLPKARTPTQEVKA